jgi:DNA-binding transcriptional ArsR family regulator
MSAEFHEAVSRAAAALGDKTRVRILDRLMDGRARTSTELAVAAEVSPSTASEHLARLREQNLVRVHAQGKRRYYALDGPAVAALVEQLSVVAGAGVPFAPRTPRRLRLARTCYDHLAGSLAVLLHDGLLGCGWLTEARGEYAITTEGVHRLNAIGVDVARAQALRRRFAYPCLDWSERKPHIAGALGAALLSEFSKAGWIVRDLDSRAVSVTKQGWRQFADRLGLRLESLTIEPGQPAARTASFAARG